MLAEKAQEKPLQADSGAQTMMIWLQSYKNLLIHNYYFLIIL